MKLLEKTEKDIAREKKMEEAFVKLHSISERFNKTNRVPEIIALLMYVLLFLIVGMFHEPWFDETEAFVIARDASIKEILFFVNHYECHPPLWHLFLAIFAKLGVNYIVTLRIAALIWNTLAVYVILFKAPFQKIYRILLPFSYYLFFQYGIVSRCYSMAIVAFLLVAITFKEKNKHPFKFSFSLIFLSFTTLYGLIFAFGITLVWLYEIMREVISLRKEDKSISVWKTVKNRFCALLILLAAAIIIMLIVHPYSNTSGLYVTKEHSYIYKLLYLLFVAPIEATFTAFQWSDTSIGFFSLEVYEIAVIVLLFLILFMVLFFMPEGYGKKKYLFIPYMIYAPLGAAMYIYNHHIGLTYLYMLFYAWICFDGYQKDDKVREKSFWETKAGKWLQTSDGKLIFNLRSFYFMIIVLIGVYWTGSSSYYDITQKYMSCVGINRFISDNNLEDAKIMIEWSSYDINDEKVVSLAMQAFLPSLTAHLGKDNNVYRFYHNEKPMNYVLHCIPTEEDEAYTLKKWKGMGYPDIFIGTSLFPQREYMSYVFDSEYRSEYGQMPEYVIVDIEKYYIITKGLYVDLEDYGATKIYMRKEMAEDLGLEILHTKYEKGVENN